jgi:hypothetical protein
MAQVNEIVNEATAELREQILKQTLETCSVCGYQRDFFALCKCGMTASSNQNLRNQMAELRERLAKSNEEISLVNLTLAEIGDRLDKSEAGCARVRSLAVVLRANHPSEHQAFKIAEDINARLADAGRGWIPAQEAIEAAQGAMVTLDAWAVALGKDPCNSDNYCRLSDWLKKHGDKLKTP